MLSLNDPTSHANSEDFKTQSSHIQWGIDFEAQRIVGSVDHYVKRQNSSNALKMFLDAHHLDIKGVFVNNQEVKFDYETKIALWGRLSVPINPELKEFTLSITYATTKECTALCWMEKELTLGKRQPYVYSQCQAIHARTLLPCQDTPGVKATYTATVKAHSGIEVLMSAVKEKTETIQGQGEVSDGNVHRFTQKIPVPSYLIAIVAGDVVGKQIGPRSTVWCEPEFVEDCSKEFEDVEMFLSTAEQLCGPYEWGVYDILVLPPTFPYGGMENPCLTFVTPCLISGDKSQVYVVAHEISHSWTGNLVTNRNWNDFWVNEGHTNYLERLILEAMQPKEKAEQYRHLHIDFGLAELQDALASYKPGHEFRKLQPHLVGLDPDDAFSRVPYEKGSVLLFYLENLVGKDLMMKWLKVYIKTHRLQSISTEHWRAFFLGFMLGNGVPESKLNEIQWEEWFKGTGDIPIDTRSMLNNGLIQDARKLADDWIAINQSDMPTINESDLKQRYDSMVVDQQCLFLRLLFNVAEIKLKHANIELFDRLYKVSASGNCEVQFSWCMLTCLAHYEPAIDMVFSFLNRYGRLMYNKPIYRLLMKWQKMSQRAVRNFEERQNFIHPVTRGEIRKIVMPFTA